MDIFMFVTTNLHTSFSCKINN